MQASFSSRARNGTARRRKSLGGTKSASKMATSGWRQSARPALRAPALKPARLSRRTDLDIHALLAQPANRSIDQQAGFVRAVVEHLDSVFAARVLHGRNRFDHPSGNVGFVIDGNLRGHAEPLAIGSLGEIPFNQGFLFDALSRRRRWKRYSRRYRCRPYTDSMAVLTMNTPTRTKSSNECMAMVSSSRPGVGGRASRAPLFRGCQICFAGVPRHALRPPCSVHLRRIPADGRQTQSSWSREAMTPGCSSNHISAAPGTCGWHSVRQTVIPREGCRELITGSFRLRHLLVVFSLPENRQPEYPAMANVEQARRATASDLIDVGSTIVMDLVGVNAHASRWAVFSLYGRLAGGDGFPATSCSTVAAISCSASKRSRSWISKCRGVAISRYTFAQAVRSSSRGLSTECSPPATGGAARR